MRAADKNRQKLSSSQSKAANFKCNSKKFKVNLATLQDYMDYMEEDKD